MSGISNKEVAGILMEMAALLELHGENIYKIRAYQNAARNLTSLQEELALLIKEDRLEEVKGIGKGIATTIKEIYVAGYSPLLEELQRKTPAGLLELIKIPGLGPATVYQLH
ncbi:MAG: histidinol-phosphatase, partial [Halanaerobiales bacterium]